MNRGNARDKEWDEVTDLEEAKEYIDSSYGKDKQFKPDDFIIDLVEGDTVLDFGGGIGRNVPPLVEKGKKVFLYDYLNMIKLARQYLGKSSVIYIEHGVPLERYRFDTVIACISLQHMKEPELEQMLVVISKICKRFVVHSRGWVDGTKSNIWKIILKSFTAMTELDENDDSDNHQTVVFVPRIPMNVLIFITFNCNNHCPYCWQRDDEDLKRYPMFDGKKWYTAIMKYFNRDKLDFTGGEPTIVKDFFFMIGLLSRNNMVSMTTNLTFDPEELSVLKRRLNSLTCSLHPTQSMKPFDFFQKVIDVKQYANNITINFVMYPPQMEELEKYKGMAEAINVRFHEDPCHGYDYSEEEKEMVFESVGKDREPLEKGDVMCTAGMEHCVIYPDGSVRSCLVKNMSLGNIFDGTFKKQDKMVYCDVRHECAGCDRDHVRMYDMDGREI